LNDGDDVGLYGHEPVAHPITGAPAIALKRQPNGDCFYLGPTGCAIHDRAPALCRDFDCQPVPPLDDSALREAEEELSAMMRLKDANYPGTGL
jgi:Fe-S-cluster containining protein